MLALSLAFLWLGWSFPLEASSQRETPLVRAIQRVRPSVVNIHSQKLSSASDTGSTSTPNQKMNGMGTGIVIDERGYIMTNFHVIEDVDPRSITISLVDGSTLTASILARDPETDLAMLRVEPRTAMPVMPLGTSSDLMHGETVVAIGNAFGYEHTITCGIISQLHRDVRLSAEQAYKDLIQTDASINPGNSGGPLINIDGEMIGLNVAIRAGAQGIGFAIPVDDVKRIAAKLLSSRSTGGIIHGISAQNLFDLQTRATSVVIDRIESGSPAQLAGLRAGDRLISLGDRRLSFTHDVERALLDRRPNEKVTAVVERNGKEESIPLILKSSRGEAGDSMETADLVWRRLGVRLADRHSGSDFRRVSTQIRGGVEIGDILPSSPANKAGLMPGDVLVGLHTWETLTPDNVVYVLSRLKGETNPIRFYIIRDGQIHRGQLSLND